MDRGGLYPSHGGVLDPLSQSLPPPAPHTPQHNAMQPAFIPPHPSRSAERSCHLSSSTPSISTPSHSSSKDRSSTLLSDHGANESLHEKSKQAVKSSPESSRDPYRGSFSHSLGSRESGSLPRSVPLRTDNLEDLSSRRTIISQSCATATIATTISKPSYSATSNKFSHQEELSLCSTSSSKSISNRELPISKQFTSSSDFDPLVKSSYSLNSGKFEYCILNIGFIFDPSFDL